MMTSANKALTNFLILINNGTFNINTPGDFTLGYGTPTVNNSSTGTININVAGQITYSSGVGFLINSGVIRKTQDNGKYEIINNFTNNGTISVEKGTLKLNSSWNSLNGGTYNVTTGNTLELADHLAVSGTLTGQIDGNLNWTGILKVVPPTEVIFNFTGPSGVNWSAGNLEGEGKLTNKGILNLIGTSAKYITGTTTLNNTGKLNINSAGEFILGIGTPTLNNASTGTINLSSTGSITYSFGVGTLVNSGVIRKTQDNGVYEILSKFTNNGGTISVEKGTFKLNNDIMSLIGGTYNVTSGNTLEWANHLTVSGTLTGQLDGQINWTGILSVDPSAEAIFNFNGTGLNWSNGNFGGNGTLTNMKILNLTSANAKYVQGSSILRNKGTINVNSVGEFVLGFGSPTVENSSSGVINLNSTGQISYAQGIGLLLNTGLIKKVQDNGVCEILSKFTNNGGTISVEKGTLKLNNNTVSLIGGTYNVTTGNTLEWADHLTLKGTLTGQLDGQINWTGILKVEPSTEAILNFNGTGLNWSSGNIEGNGTLTNKKILNLIGLDSKNVQGTSILKNDGTINVNSAGEIVLGYGIPKLNNSASGVINLKTNGAISFAQGIGILENSGLIKREGNSGNFAISANTNNISPGKIICETGILSFGTYTGNGILGGNGSVQLVNNTNFEGTISPGGSPGTLTHVGNYKSSANTILASEISGTTSGTQYDVFKVQGDVDMNGTIKVDLKYAAKLNDEFVLLTANNITSCNLPATLTANYDSHNYTFNVMCNPKNVTLKVASIILGIEENELSSNLSLYPNPSNGHFSINLGKEYTNVTVQITNTLGQIISSKKYPSSKIIESEINDSYGLHFVKVIKATGESTTLKILKY